jgi:hypothetical protein
VNTLTHSRRPITLPWNGHDFLVDYVYKREFSGCCQHVFIPQRGRALTKQQQAKIRCESYFKWMAQSYAPLLEKFGEWRIFFIGGKPVLILHTAREDGEIWSCAQYERGYTLEETR